MCESIYIYMYNQLYFSVDLVLGLRFGQWFGYCCCDGGSGSLGNQGEGCRGGCEAVVVDWAGEELWWL